MSSIQPSRLFAAGGRSVCVCVGGGSCKAYLAGQTLIPKLWKLTLHKILCGSGENTTFIGKFAKKSSPKM